MTSWQPLLFWQNELKERDSRLKTAPDNIDLLFERAIILRELGQTAEARNSYIEILNRNPTHFGTLNNLGALLLAENFSAAAITAYREAVKHHPDNPKGHANLADTLFRKGELEEALLEFREALRLDPEYKTAHQGIAYILREKGDEEGARIHRQKGFESNAVLTIPYRGTGSPVVLVMLASAMGGMIPMQQHLDDHIFHTTTVFVEFYDATVPLPPHQLVFNAIGDADICASDLEKASALLHRINTPVINHPDAVRLTGRADNARRLGNLPGVIAAKTTIMQREILTPSLLEKEGFPFPFLLRRPGFHTGQYFMRVTNDKELAAALAAIPGDDLMVMQFIDARSKDGKVRKYRVMMIKGKLYPLHVAVSRDWKVHYFTAEMSDNAEHRAEDAAFLENMPKVLGARAMKTLQLIQAALGLDYAGIDFSLNAAGDIILFEANATMTVNPPDRDARWDYRRDPVRRVQEAIRTMLMHKA